MFAAVATVSEQKPAANDVGTVVNKLLGLQLFLSLTAIDRLLVLRDHTPFKFAAVEESVCPIDGEPVGSAHFTSVHTGFDLISLIALKCQVSGSSIIAHFP